MSNVWKWLCGKAASGLERILCGVLVKRKHGQVHWRYNWNTVENVVKLHTINQSINQSDYQEQISTVEPHLIVVCKSIQFSGKSKSFSWVNPYPNEFLVFKCLQYKSFENTVGKWEIARNEQFLLFPQCFLPVWRTFCHFHQISKCRLQSLWVWKSLKFVVWERIRGKPQICLLVRRMWCFGY